MRVIQDDLWLCGDCLQAAVNDDYTGLDYYYNPAESELKEKAIRDGLAALGGNLVIDSDGETGDGCDEFSRKACDCCGTTLAGHRERFAILGE